MADGVVIKVDGDASGFQKAVADAPKVMEQALSGVTAGAEGASHALDGVARSGASISESLGTGAGFDKLIGLAEKAELANAKLASLKARVEESASALGAAQAAAHDEAAALAELQASASITAELLAEANVALKDTSNMNAWMQAKEDAKEFEADLKKLDAAIAKQKTVVSNTDATVKKFSDSYAKLSEQMASAEISANTANEKFELMAQSLTNVADNSLPGFDGAAVSTMRSTGNLSDVLNDLASGAFTEVSQSAMRSVRGLEMFGGSSVVTSAAARGLQSVLRTMVGAGGGWLMFAAAAAYAAYKIYDVSSGAAAAREAIENLKETAESWEKTNVKTGFEGSGGMKAFGLAKEDFAGAISTVRDWRDEVVRVWSDGKKESKETVKEMVDGFTSETDTVRKKLSEIKETAGRGGFAGDGFLEGLDTDVERLGEIDKEVEKLLKKKQGGKLDEKDQATLTGLYDERQAIVVKYRLEPESNTGFDKITQDLDAALSRGADPAKSFTDAYAAATEGVGAFTDALNAEYDAQYAALEMSGQLFDENGEKTAAFLALQAWYNEQATKGVEDYNQAVADASEKTGAFGENGKYTKTAEELEKIKKLMDEAAGGTDNQATTDLADALGELDETQIVEVSAALTSMKAAAEQAGVPLDENAQKMLDLLGYIKGATGTSSFEGGLQESLDKMFGEGLDSEVHEVFTALNVDSLSTAFDAWAQGAHADIIPTIETDPLKTTLDSWAGGYKLGVDGELQKVDPATGELTDTGYRFGVDGKIKKVNPATGVLEDTNYRLGVDGRLEEVDPSGATTSDTEYRFEVDGELVTLIESPNIAKPTITIDGEVTVKKVNFEEGEFTNSTNPELEFKAAQAKSNQGSESWITSSDVENISAVASAIKDYNEALESGDSDALMAMGGSLAMLGDTVGTKLTAGGFETMAQSIANGLDQLKEGKLTPEDAEALQKYIDDVTAILDSGFSLGRTMGGEDLAQGISDALTEFGWETTASTISTDLTTALDSAKSKAATSGENFGQGYVDGILAKEAAARTAGAALGAAAAAGLKSAQQEASPSKVTRKSGGNFGLGYIGGIADRVRDAQAAGSKLARAGIAGLNVGNLHMAAAMSGSATGSAASPFPFTLDEFADAVAQRPANLYADKRVMATTMATDNTRAQSERQRSLAQGYGGKG